VKQHAIHTLFESLVRLLIEALNEVDLTGIVGFQVVREAAVRGSAGLCVLKIRPHASPQPFQGSIRSRFALFAVKSVIISLKLVAFFVIV
jgi:hypothetical protein